MEDEDRKFTNRKREQEERCREEGREAESAEKQKKRRGEMTQEGKLVKEIGSEEEWGRKGRKTRKCTEMRERRMRSLTKLC